MADIGMQYSSQVQSGVYYTLCKYILLRARIRTLEGLVFKQLTKPLPHFSTKQSYDTIICYANIFGCPGQLKR